MSTSHICRERPGYTEAEDPWADGSVASCPHHDKRGRKQTAVRWGRKARSKIDREVGVVGKDTGGGYING